jgi:hypothetical protein
VFARGTAARITPVGKVVGPDTAWRIADHMAGPVTTRLSELLMGLHRESRRWYRQGCAGGRLARRAEESSMRTSAMTQASAASKWELGWYLAGWWLG